MKKGEKMPRLIDADELKTIMSIQSGNFNSIETIQKWIDDTPTVDAVPVVRCRNCKWHMNWDGELECGLHDGFYETGSEWFCADGERRADGQAD